MSEVSTLKLACFSDKGTVRSNNEDNMYSSVFNISNDNSEDYYSVSFDGEYTDELCVFAIFDGMGGTEGGEIASLVSSIQMTHLVSNLKKRELLTENNLMEELCSFKKMAEEEIIRTVNDSKIEQPGSTCCGFILLDEKVRPFWIGDSRLYLLRKNQLILLTKDHTIAQEKIDYGLISPEEAATVSSWHYITKYIGDMQNDFVVGQEFSAEPGDKYLLCTDGISDKFKPETIADKLSHETNTFIEYLESEVKKESKDNATAIVIELNSEPKKKEITDIIKEKTRSYFTAIGVKAKESSLIK